MKLLFLIQNKAFVASCDDPSRFAIEHAEMVIGGPVQLIKDRWGLQNALTYSREELDTEVKQLLLDAKSNTPSNLTHP